MTRKLSSEYVTGEGKILGRSARNGNGGFLGTGNSRTSVLINSAGLDDIASELSINREDINQIFMIFKNVNDETDIKILKLSKFGEEDGFRGYLSATDTDDTANEYEEVARVVIEDDGTSHLLYDGMTLTSPEVLQFIQEDENGDIDVSSFFGWVQEAKILASDIFATDGFTKGIDVDGDLVAVGSPDKGSNAGAAYVYKTADGGDNWSEHKVTISAGAGFHWSGFSVAISGNNLAVGLPVTGDNMEGAIYTYKTTDNGSTWGSEQIIVPPSVVGSIGGVGFDVAMEGNRMAVAANYLTKVFVYTYTEGLWGNEKIIDLGVGNQPKMVELSGDTVVIGAEDDEKAFVYITSDGGTSWTLQQTLTSSVSDSGDKFGSSVAIDGDIIAIGARLEDGVGNALNLSGAVNVFTRSGITWTEQEILHASDAQVSDFFGQAVTVTGTTIYVGADGEDGGAEDPSSAAGAVYKFTTSDGGVSWTEDVTIMRAGDAGVDKHFGKRLATDGSRMAVGSIGTTSVIGGAYIFG